MSASIDQTTKQGMQQNGKMKDDMDADTVRTWAQGKLAVIRNSTSNENQHACSYNKEDDRCYQLIVDCLWMLRVWTVLAGVEFFLLLACYGDGKWDVAVWMEWRLWVLMCCGWWGGCLNGVEAFVARKPPRKSRKGVMGTAPGQFGCFFCAKTWKNATH